MSTRYRAIDRIRNNEENDYQPTDEQKYWMQLAESAVFEESACVINCDFRPVSPFNLASASGSKLIVFDTNVCQPVAIYSRFKAPISYIKYRSDGALLGVSTQNGRLQFFDVHGEKDSRNNKQGSRNAIRTFKSECQIDAFDYDQTGRKVASFAHNGCVKLYDLSTDYSEPLWNCKAHDDVVRTGAFAKSSDHYLASGSYDQKVRYWDIRQKGDNCLQEFDHGFPVEKILFLEDENMIASAGGPIVKIWNINSGQLLNTLKLHNKTITSMCLTSDGRYLFTGAIDRRIKIVQLDNNDFEPIHSFKVEAQVLSLCIDFENQCMAVGMDNKLAIYKRNEQRKAQDKKLKKKEKRRNNKNYFKKVSNLNESSEITKPEEITITEKERGGIVENINLELSDRQLDQLTLGKNDYLLREGSYRELVSKILLHGKMSAEYIVAVFQQFRIRQVLEQALSNQGKKELQQLFGFLSTHLFEAPFSDILYVVAIKAIEIYTQKPIPREVKKNVKWWEKKVAAEIAMQKQLCQNIGVIQMLDRWNRMNSETMEIDLNVQKQSHYNGQSYGSDHDQTNSETSSIT